MNLPNIITIVRILLIPVFVVIFLMANSWSYLAAATLFALAAATDWLDGYLARKLNQTTPFGAFIDPVADKLHCGVRFGDIDRSPQLYLADTAELGHYWQRNSHQRTA